jgi:hypothetical protein
MNDGSLLVSDVVGEMRLGVATFISSHIRQGSRMD